MPLILNFTSIPKCNNEMHSRSKLRLQADPPTPQPKKRESKCNR